LVAAAKFLVAATKILFVFPDFVAVPKTFFSVTEPEITGSENSFKISETPHAKYYF